jgi:hypothetical protein
VTENNYETSMSVPLDSDGFMRRQCPTCERELKWLARDEQGDEANRAPEGGYHCPYCAIQAPGDSWWTEAQLQMAHSILMEEVVAPELDKFKRQVEGMNVGGLISFSVATERAAPVDPLIEIDDMWRVDFPCHSGASVKVLEDWHGDVHCPICGEVPNAV